MATQTAVVDGGRIETSSRPPDSGSVVATRIEVALLAGFEVRVDGVAVASRHWARRNSAALVKLLALSPHRSLHRDVVIDALWPDVDMDDAAPRLHKSAHYARRALGHQDAVVLNAEMVSLGPFDEVWVDVVQFRELAAGALNDGGVASAKSALAKYRGELLPGDLYEPWTEPHRTRLRGLYLEMLHQAKDWHQALAAEPADEPAHLALVERYSERGNRAAALRQLDQLDHVLREDLGLDPSERARALRRHILQETRTSHVIDVDGDTSDDATACPTADPHTPCCA